jgi:hypothetical protein
LDLLVTCQLHGDGSIEGVSDLAEKIEVIHRCAPWIRRLMVAAGDHADLQQRGELERASEVGIRILPVASAAEAILTVFPDLYGRLCETHGWTPAVFVDLLLHETADLTSRPAFWRVLSELPTEGFVGSGPVSDLVQSKVAVVRSVALRRLGQPAELDAAPHRAVLKALPRERSLTTLAHLIQGSVFDGQIALDELQSWLVDARVAVPMRWSRRRMNATFRDGSEAELRVYGALARAELAWGDTALAARLNAALFLAWLEIDPAQASYPLTQLIAHMGLDERVQERDLERWILAWREAGGARPESARHVATAVERTARLRRRESLHCLAAELREASAAGASRATARPNAARGKGAAPTLLELWETHGEEALVMPGFDDALRALNAVQQRWFARSPHDTLRARLAVWPWPL